MDELTRQLRIALRRLARAPLFTTVAVVTLAVGIGANAAIFSVVDSVLIKPLPYDRPDELVTLSFTAPAIGMHDAMQSQATYLTYRADATTFQDIGIWNNLAATVTGVGEPERVQAMQVTDGTLPVLGATAAAGPRGPNARITGAIATVVLVITRPEVGGPTLPPASSSRPAREAA